MPAIELNSMTPNSEYNYAKEKAVFKLWLVMTTNQMAVANGVELFDTTAAAEEFQASVAESEQPVYYIDLEKLSADLDVLGADYVTQTVHSLMADQQGFLQQAANLYWSISANICEYGLACITMQKALDIDEPATGE